MWENSVPQNSGTSTVRELALGVRWWQQRVEHVGVRYGWNYRNDWHFRRKGYIARRILKVGPWRKPLLKRVSSGPKGGTRGVCSFRVEILIDLSSLQTLTLVDVEVSSTSGSFLCPRTSKVRKYVNTNILTSREAVFSEQTESTAAPMDSPWGTFMSHSLGFLAYTRQSFSCMLCHM